MRELLRSNDPVLISFICALLADSGIEVVVLDMHTSILEGSIGALPRRVMVAGDALAAARHILDEADIPHGGSAQ